MVAKAGSGDIVTRIRRRLGRRMREAFTFLVATAWSELFNDVFQVIAGGSTHILMRLLHAFMFTLLAVAVTILFDNEKDED
jgi:hypothetical protein